MALRSRRPGGRRSGPADEPQWWDPSDQAKAEVPLLNRRDLPRGWRPVPMLNNVERLDPWEGVPEAEPVRAVREARRLTALDEGTAWRDAQRRLLVVRVEVFADEQADETQHREIWRAEAVRCLEATWRARWAEREHVGAWIEARPYKRDDEQPAPTTAVPVDHYEIEDHSDPQGGGAVTMYQHLTFWAGRGHVVLTGRHPLGSDVTELDQIVTGLAKRVASLAPVGTGPGST